MIMLATAPLGWMWLRLNKMENKLEQVFTKDETKEFIDLKNQPIIDAVDRNTKAQEELAHAVQDLRKELMIKVNAYTK